MSTKPDFFVISDADQAVITRQHRYMRVGGVAAFSLAVALLVLAFRLLSFSLPLALCTFVIAPIAAIFAFSRVITYAATPYRLQLTEPHNKMAQAWFRDTYGLTLTTEQVHALVFGGRLGTWENPQPLEQGPVRFYGETTTGEYPSGIRFLHSAKLGYHVQSVKTGEEIEHQRDGVEVVTETQTPADTGIVRELPFLEMTAAERKAERRDNTAMGTFFALAFIAMVGGMLLFTNTHTSNLLLWGALIVAPVMVSLVLVMTGMRYGVRSYGSTLDSHLAAGEKWLADRYGLELDRERSRTLLFGDAISTPSHLKTEQHGKIRRYGTVPHDIYRQGLQLIYSEEKGYQVIDLNRNQELQLREAASLSA
jgi:hypothetical protein